MKNTISAWDVQRALQIAGAYKGDLDGDIGPKTEAAITKFVSDSKRAPASWAKWSLSRIAIVALQIVLADAGFAQDVGEIDGYVGPSTRYAYTSWEYKRRTGRLPSAWRPDDVKPDAGKIIEVKGNEWGTQKEIERRFGKAGGPQCTAGVVKSSYALRVAWSRAEKISQFRCHEKIATAVERVLGRVASEYSGEEISELGLDLFGGCFNYRNKRGGKTLSTHAYGVATDWDPERNQLKWNKNRARLGQADASKFWVLWKEEKFTSLGVVRDFDWMHVQAPGV